MSSEGTSKRRFWRGSEGPAGRRAWGDILLFAGPGHHSVTFWGLEVSRGLNADKIASKMIATSDQNETKMDPNWYPDSEYGLKNIEK